MATDARSTQLPLRQDLDEVDAIPVRTYWQLVRIRFLQHRLAVLALAVLAVMIAVSIVVPAVTGDAYRSTNLALHDAGPSLTAPLGYNELGQNIFVRLTKATQTTLLIGFLAVVIIVVIGVLVGSIAGYVGGAVDNGLMRLVDVILSLPFLILVILIVSMFGLRDMRVIVIALGITGWTTAARLVRAEFLSTREADYVLAARALGVGHRRIITRHMLPSSMAPLIVAAALGVADAVVVESALSYLGFGVTAPDVSIGTMLNDAQRYFFSDNERLIYPAVTLVVIVICASFIGDGMRDALDPRQRVDH
jgi:peptide/nickel transport system permease protein